VRQEVFALSLIALDLAIMGTSAQPKKNIQAVTANRARGSSLG
jgi:hypothetical protein